MVVGGLRRIVVRLVVGAFSVALAVPALAGCGGAGGGVPADPGRAGAADPGRENGASSAGSEPVVSGGAAAVPSGVSGVGGPDARSGAAVRGEGSVAGAGSVVEVLPAGLPDPVSSDPAPELAIEIFEPAEFGLEFGLEMAGRALQERPVEWVEPDGVGGGSVGSSSALGDVYTWHDGDRTAGARLHLDLVALADGSIVARGDAVGGAGGGEFGFRAPAAPRGVDSSDGGRSGGDGGFHPVFVSESDEQMTLPGGVLVALDPEWDAEAVAAFFARNGVGMDRVSGLGWLVNGFFVETGPGFASLDLANALAGQAGVEISTPNWLMEISTR